MQNFPIFEIVISIVCLVIIVEIVYIVINSKKNKLRETDESIVYPPMGSDVSPFIVAGTVANSEVIYSEEIIEESGYSPIETMPVYPSEEDWAPCTPEPTKAEDNWFLASDFSEVQSGLKVPHAIDTYTPSSEPTSYSYTDSGSSDSYTSSSD